jgi:hypothetical protein
MVETHSVGKHRVELDGDIIHFVYGGDYTGEDAVGMTQLSAELVRRHPRAYALCDISGVGAISTEARQAWLEWFRKHTLEAIVCYGAGSFSTRTVLKMFVAAARILLRLEPHFVFVSTETQARTWIQQHRARSG